MEKQTVVNHVFGWGWLSAYWLLYLVTNVACAYYAYQDAIKRKNRTLNIHPYWWAAFALIGGIWTVLIYWLMEHSALRQRSQDTVEND